MTLYYQDDHVTIYHGDCLEVLPTISGVGQVLTSPPYNLSGYSASNKEFAALANGYDTYNDALPHDDYVAWQREVMAACWATLTDDGAIFYNHKPRVGGPRVLLPLELIPDNLPIRQIITWDRGSGFNRNATFFVPCYEWVIVVAKPSWRTAVRGAADDVWRFRPSDDSATEGHPAPFPLGLATTAIGATNATTVLDPFMGSGTTLRAAKDLGRKAIGIEISERYCEIAARRMGQEVLAL